MTRLGLLEAAAKIPRPTPRPIATATPQPTPVTVEELTEVLSTAATNEEKTSFLIEFLLSQRSIVMDAVERLIVALLVFWIGKRLVRVALRITSRWMGRRDVEISVQKFVMSFARVLYYIILAFAVSWVLGMAAMIVTLISSASIAVGLALQGSLSNFAGGILILLLKPFKVGEYIAVSDVEGTVEAIDIFYTHLSTVDNKTIVVPNGTITNTTITNITQVSKRMMILDFMVSYGTDIEGLRKKLLDMMRKDEFLCQDEAIDIVVTKFSPIKIQMQVKAWAKTENYWKARYGVLEKMKGILEDEEYKNLIKL